MRGPPRSFWTPSRPSDIHAWTGCKQRLPAIPVPAYLVYARLRFSKDTVFATSKRESRKAPVGGLKLVEIVLAGRDEHDRGRQIGEAEGDAEGQAEYVHFQALFNADQHTEQAESALRRLKALTARGSEESAE